MRLTFDVTRVRTIAESGTISVEVPDDMFSKIGERVIAEQTERALQQKGFIIVACEGVYEPSWGIPEQSVTYTVERWAHETRSSPLHNEECRRHPGQRAGHTTIRLPAPATAPCGG